MFQNILVVCLGNICRSPTAERLLQKKLPRHQISSAGLKALTGNDADFQAIKTALKHGVIVAGHTARQLTAEMFAQWLPKKTVPDPFNQSSEMFEAVYLQLEEAAQAWARKLNASA